MIVLLLICLNSWSQINKPIVISTGKVLKTDTSKVLVSINFIRDANAKLIERVYLIEVTKQQDSIIRLNKVYISEQLIVIKDFQTKVVVLNNNINSLNKSVINYKQNNAVLKGITAATIIGFIITLILK